MIDYTEELFNAIKTISKKEIEALKFDTTVEVTITDASKANLGIYTVTNGSIYFTAYSTEAYKEKDRVLVMIPQGDYDQQKIIIGKKTNEDVNKPINYIEPFSQIIDITNNLVPKSIAKIGMIANGENYKWENNDTTLFTGDENILNPTSLIWSAREYNKILEALESLNTILSGYREGNTDQIYINEYQILMDYSDYDEEKEEFVWDAYFDNFYHFIGDENAIKIMKEVILSSDDGFKEEKGLTRIGLKADFKTLLKQFNTISGNYGLVLCVGFRNSDEQLFEDSILSSTIIQPFIFDSKNFFGNIYNFNAYYTQEAIFDISQYSDLILSDIFLFAYQKGNFKDINGKLISSEVPENIFINNYYVCLGNDISNFKGDSLELYSFNSRTFNKNGSDDAIKKIYLRWIHQDETTNIVKALNDNEIIGLENYEIRWYRYKLNVKDIDAFAGAHWERIENNLSTYNLNVDISKNIERILAIVIKNKTELIATSNILEFTSEKDTVNIQIIKDINALNILYEDDFNGKYFVYDSMQNVLNNEDTVIRKLTAVFAENIDNIYNKPILTDCESIKWIFPDSNSMIIPLDFNQNVIYFNNEDENYEVYNEDGLDFTISHENNSYIITKNNLTNNSNIKKYTSIYYKINKNLNFNLGTNNVYLEVVKEGQTYRATTTMQFDIASTTGSKYTLTIDWDNNNKMFDIKGTGSLQGRMVLKLNNEEVILNADAKYSYTWYKKGANALLKITSSDDNYSKFEITKQNSSLNINDLYILEVSLEDFEEYNLIFREPIPLTNLYNDNEQQIYKINQFFGPTQVRYTTDNIAEYDKTPYSTTLQYYENGNWYTTNSTIDAVGVWKLVPYVNNFKPNIDFNLINLNFDTTAIINRIQNFFINDTRVDDEEILLNRKKLFNRLININLNSDSSINELIDQLNNPLSNNEKENQYLNNETNFNNDIQKFFNNNYNTSTKLKELLLLFFKISVISENYPTKLTGLLKVEPWESYCTSVILSPPSFYTSNLSLYGIQFEYNEQTLLTYPIYVYQHNYPLSTLNDWDGQLKINDDTGTIFSKGLSAGVKESDNTFTGVILGDWRESGVATSFNTGIYGFNHNIMTYALKDDGSAFFGNETGGKISLNDNHNIELKVQDNNSLVQIKPGSMLIQQKGENEENNLDLLRIDKDNYFLQSGNFSEKLQKGMQFNLQTGKVIGYDFSLSSQKRTATTDYFLTITDGSKDSFLKIGRDRKINFFSNSLEEKQFEQIITARDNLFDYRDSLYNKIFQAITLFNSIDLYSLDLNYDEDLKEVFQPNSNLINNSIKKNYPKLLELDFSSAEINEIKQLYAIDTSKESCQDWYFGIIPTNLLKIITIEQAIELLTALEISINLSPPNEESFSFNKFLKENESSNEEDDETSTTELQISEETVIKLIEYLERKNKNLYYPKIPNSKLKINKLVESLYDYEISDYNSLLENVKNGNVVPNDTIPKLNQEAQRLINKYNILEVENREKKTSTQNYTWETYTYDNNLTDAEDEKYILFKQHDKKYILLNNVDIEHDSNVSDGYFLGFANSERTEPDLAKNCDQSIFFKPKTYGIYESEILKPSENLLKYVYILEKNRASITEKTYKRYRLGTTWYQNLKNSALVQFHLYINYASFDTEQVDYYTSLPAATGTSIILSMNILDQTEGIGLEKIQFFYSNTLNQYADNVRFLSNSFTENNEQSNIVTWTYNNARQFSQIVHAPIVSLVKKIEHEVSNNNYYLKYDIYNDENKIDEIFEDGYIKIPQKEIQYVYKYNNNTFTKVSKDNDYDIFEDQCRLRIRDLNDPNIIIVYYVLLHKYQGSFFKKVLISEKDSNNIQTSEYFNFTTLGLQELEKALYKKAKEDDASSFFSVNKWTNDLININKNGGYITSKDYRPTITTADMRAARLPTDNQENYTDNWSQGMKGFVIDLTNNRIFLGNNSSIQGVQTQYYPGQTSSDHRHFIISTGVNMSAIGEDSRDRISGDNQWFILAQGGPTSGRNWPFRYLFGVDWNGIVHCRGIEYF